MGFIRRILKRDFGVSDAKPSSDILTLGLYEEEREKLSTAVAVKYGISVPDSILVDHREDTNLWGRLQRLLDHMTEVMGPEFPDDHGFLQLTEEQFDARYKPESHDDGSFYVQREWRGTLNDRPLLEAAVHAKCCWTAVDGDDGQFVITWGNRVVNRLYNIITENPIEDEVWHVETYDPDEEEILNNALLHNL